MIALTQKRRRYVARRLTACAAEIERIGLTRHRGAIKIKIARPEDAALLQQVKQVAQVVRASAEALIAES